MGKKMVEEPKPAAVPMISDINAEMKNNISCNIIIRIHLGRPNKLGKLKHCITEVEIPLTDLAEKKKVSRIVTCRYLLFFTTFLYTDHLDYLSHNCCLHTDLC